MELHLYILSMAAFVLQWQSRVVVADTAWLAELKYLLCLFKKKFVDPWSKQSEEVRSVITCFYRRGNRSSESLSKLLKLIRDPAKTGSQVYVIPGHTGFLFDHRIQSVIVTVWWEWGYHLCDTLCLFFRLLQEVIQWLELTGIFQAHNNSLWLASLTLF